MAINNIIQQSRIKEIFKKVLLNNRLAHAYLFYGPEGSGKAALALEISKILNCTEQTGEACDVCPSCRKINHAGHPDVQMIMPTPSAKSPEEHNQWYYQKAENPYKRVPFRPAPISIRIDAIRQLKRTASLKPYEGKWKCALIFEVEQISEEAANSLLKLLEEPPEKMIIILSSSRPEKILQTLVSRCQQIRFDKLLEDDVKSYLLDNYTKEENKAGLISKLSGGNIRRAIDFLDLNLSEHQEEAIDFLRTAIVGKPSRIAPVIEKLSGEKDKSYLRDLLFFLLIWIKDAFIIREIGMDENIVNEMRREEIKRFILNFPKSQLIELIEEIETAIDLLNKNVYINLVLINLAFKMKRYVNS